VSEVDEFEHAINHGVAQRHQCVNAAHSQSVCYLLKELFHRLLLSTFADVGTQCYWKSYRPDREVPKGLRIIIQVLRKNIRISVIICADFEQGTGLG